ncbi:MAG: thioredoxin fold domain-containing protein [Fimbriimonadaceae bacterium]|nr:thioredoxin fold domain-containing protein [Fimbriimonadaceae bacterium]QYK59662.1 MAG: thioredoxin fold domain-containing protein [Fimbriimonadaceae bacterium]
MNTRSIALFALAAFAALANANEIAWSKSFADASTSAKESGRLVMVDFYTDWCGWCKRLDATTFKDGKVVKQSEAYVAVKVDAEKEGVELAKKYEVSGFPTILFLDGEAVVGRINGYLAPSAWVDTVDMVLWAHKEAPKVAEALKSKPEDGEANASMAVILGIRGQGGEAEAFLDKAVSAGYQGDKLAKAYNSVGDYYQMEANDPKKAIGYFAKAMAVGKTSSDRSYARTSIMYCHMMAGDLAAAKKVAKEVMDSKDSSQEDKELAQSVLKEEG